MNTPEENKRRVRMGVAVPTSGVGRTKTKNRGKAKGNPSFGRKGKKTMR